METLNGKSACVRKPGEIVFWAACLRIGQIEHDTVQTMILRLFPRSEDCGDSCFRGVFGVGSGAVPSGLVIGRCGSFFCGPWVRQALMVGPAPQLVGGSRARVSISRPRQRCGSAAAVAAAATHLCRCCVCGRSRGCVSTARLWSGSGSGRLPLCSGVGSSVPFP